MPLMEPLNSSVWIPVWERCLVAMEIRMADFCISLLHHVAVFHVVLTLTIRLSHVLFAQNKITRNNELIVKDVNMFL